MAKTLSNSGITSNDTIRAGHVTQSIDALTGADAYDITISGSLSVIGTTSGSFIGDGTGLTGVTGEWDGSHNGNASITGSLTVTSDVSSSSNLWGTKLLAAVSVKTPIITSPTTTLTVTDNLDVIGQITASGDISSSADVYGITGSFGTYLGDGSQLTGITVLETINDNLVLEGTSNTSTSQAIYGVNIITTSTTSDLATKLPTPTTGKQTIFINNSLLPIRVFPSVVGGEINGVVNGFASIPNDGRAYTFYCTENPLPGAWTWSAPATSQIELQEMEINHTFGVDSLAYNAGQGNGNFGALSVGGPTSNAIVLIGEWNTEIGSKTVTKLKCYTNIKWADIATASSPDIQAGYYNGYAASPFSVGNGQRATATFEGSALSPFNDIQEVTTGTVGNNVGDVGTLYMELDMALAYPIYSIIGDQGASGAIAGIDSSGYYSFGMNLDSTVQTKLYKFKWFMECF